MISPAPSSPIAPVDAPFNAQAKRRRQATRAAQWAGTVLAAAGVLCVLCGGILPWATLKVWGVQIVPPGLVFIWGGASVGAALLAGARLGQKRFPWAVAVLGLLPVCAGVYAPKQAGQAVRGFILRIENTLAPTNARLAQAAIPPLEPFSGVGSAQSYVGPGPSWTLWGGILTDGRRPAFCGSGAANANVFRLRQSVGGIAGRCYFVLPVVRTVRKFPWPASVRKMPFAACQRGQILRGVRNRRERLVRRLIQ